jgi:uncharacterized membrane protein
MIAVGTTLANFGGATQRQTISDLTRFANIDQHLTTMKIAGIVLIALGAIMLIWTGFTYTKKEKVIDAGPLEVSADKEKTVSWPPYAGGILVVGGIALVALAKKN